MAEHLPKGTVEARYWCKPCNGPTMHYVYDGRKGGCKECIKKREAEAATRKQQPVAATQESLF